MADIATVFHWPPSVMFAESLTDLLEWRHKAILRNGAGDDE
ncbi:GpE family phage tail protein [Pantoea allii]|nr:MULTISPECIES: GpE family phage tail protein [Pantoea]MCH9300551.1 GpE family phage tail protein [Pantoea allii]MDJ0037342.1 GpE family phage tail protein [Pantoea allii]NQS87074.1 GpE family phage tail protein [Pantoea allii]OAE09985.1 phage tail protein [Pantoea sp. OXWO6B1]